MLHFYQRSMVAIPLMCWLFFCSHLAASDVMLAVDGNSVQVGQDEVITILFANDSGEQELFIPTVINGVFLQSGIEYPSTLTKENLAKPIKIVPGAYQKITYSVQVPSLLNGGLATLKILGQYEAAILLHIEVVNGMNALAANNEPEDTIDPIAIDGQEESADFVNLSPYKPIYFLGGINPRDAKFQISFKYQLFNENGSWAKKNPWLAGFHLGYSQVSFWSLDEESKPFEDTNFMPEVFYQVKDIRLSQYGDLALQAGVLHESNGRDGLGSRSLNILYGRASYEHNLGQEWFARLTGEAWSYVGSLEDNPDIADFRGHSSLQLVLGHQKGIQLSSYRRGPIGGGKSSYLFDLTVPVKRIDHKRNFNFTFHSQLFTGYGENLLTYNQKETRLRFGIGIHR